MRTSPASWLAALLAWALAPVVTPQAVFSSVQQMGKLVSLEKSILSELRKQADSLSTALADIEKYVKEVSDVYRECGDEECSEEETEKILGNPIHNYQLLRRVTVTWKKVVKSIESVDTKQAVTNLRKTKKSQMRQLPGDEDLALAARSLTNLQEVYQLRPRDLARGRLLGADTGAALSTQDLVYLATTAAAQHRPAAAVALLEEAAAMLEAGNVTGGHRASVESLLARERSKVQPRRAEARYKLGQVPAQTTDPAQLTTAGDKENYEALCRGQQLLPASVARGLLCWYSARGDPYYTLHPLAVEEAHPRPHQVLVLHHLLSAREADQVAALATRGMKQSGIGRDKQLSSLRQSQSHWVEDGKHPLVDSLSARMNWVTGLQTSLLYDKHGEGKKEEYEYLQLGSYGTGGYYNVHQDPLFVYKKHDYIATSVEARGRDSYNTGDRMSTLMLYLTEVTAGGYTAFPRLGVAVRPEKGAAVLWHNLHEDGWSDMAMLHGGCPVLLGRKLVANKWIREVANIFHRPCLSQPSQHSF